jgi:hypothetical protein
VQNADRVFDEEEDNRHRNGAERAVGERQAISFRQHDVGSRRPFACEHDYLFAVVQPSDARAGYERVAQQQPAAAADLKQVIGGPERESVEDRASREVVYVLRSVYLPRPRAGRPARNPVDQPLDERFVRQAALLPRCEVLVAEAERAQRVLVSLRSLAAQGVAIVTTLREPLSEARQPAEIRRMVRLRHSLKAGLRLPRLGRL